MKCPNCEADAFLVNPKHDIWQCSESGTIYEKKPCMYGCFFGVVTKPRGDEHEPR